LQLLRASDSVSLYKTAEALSQSTCRDWR